MNLKTLALMVWIAQALQILLMLYRYGIRFSDPLVFLQLGLNLPLVAFFFYVWKRQKP